MDSANNTVQSSTNSLKLYSQANIKIEIPKIKESHNTFLNFFSGNKKQEIIDLKIYKSEAIIGLKDSSIIIYDILREYQKLNFDVMFIF